MSGSEAELCLLSFDSIVRRANCLDHIPPQRSLFGIFDVTIVMDGADRLQVSFARALPEQ